MEEKGGGKRREEKEEKRSAWSEERKMMCLTGEVKLFLTQRNEKWISENNTKITNANAII